MDRAEEATEMLKTEGLSKDTACLTGTKLVVRSIS